MAQKITRKGKERRSYRLEELITDSMALPHKRAGLALEAETGFQSNRSKAIKLHTLIREGTTHHII